MSGARVRGFVRRSVARLYAALSAEPRAGLRILTYHRVNDDHPRDRLSVCRAAFREQMGELARSGAAVVPLESAAAALARGEPPAAGAVAITFDDGYADNLSNAHPILAELGLAATLFVATAFVGTRDMLERYRGCCAGDGMLDWDQLERLAQAGWSIGGHGRRHRELAPLAEEPLREEVEGCADDIEARLGRRPLAFCYPRGSHSPAARRAVEAAGFTSACSVRPGANRPGADPLLLSRTEIAGSDSLADFRLKLAGGFDAWHRAVQRARAGAPA